MKQYFQATRTKGRVFSQRMAFALSLLTGLVAVGIAACSQTAPTPTAIPPTPEPAAAPAATLDRNAISPILATTLLRTGTQRVSFLLTTPDALVKTPEVTVTTTFLGEGDAAGGTARARFRLWPYSIRGAYDTELTFPSPGPWRLDITVADAEISGDASLEVDVAEAIVVPDIGAVPPASQTKTLESEGGLKTLTTAYSPDPDLYLVSVADAIAASKPAVVVFATPAFCTTPTCGPQVDTVSELQAAHPKAANYVHVEIYDNPQEIQGDLTRARITGAVQEWGFDQIPHWFNESWTYVLDADGQVHQKFEGFVTLEELEQTLQEVLPSG
jgi:hypothetical protein